MTLSWNDHVAINELIALHGHLCDTGELDRLDEVFTPDVAYDVTDFGFGVLRGLTGNRDAALALGDRNPVGHHVTNIILTEHGPDRVLARSKGIGIMADGKCGSVTYDDTVVRREEGWRISERIVRARRVPLGG
ncbi:hypothetical protein ABH926_000814 [Catenulispora sp. GP43]|uniref:nuclear transport factor 2 family protein n=1 Tax=Catenulispora sp. GP43 TaxID=3156263 RepID=UPI00351533B9